jgi:hypothetical protein
MNDGMDTIDEDDLRRLTGQERDAEYELDLRGLDGPHGRDSVRLMLERSRFRAPRSVVVRLDPPPEGGGETLFQPIGRMLLEARRTGVLDRFSTLPSDTGLGFHLVTSGRDETALELEPEKPS